MADDQTQKVKAFWEEQARIFKASPLATAPDTYYRDLEIRSILSYLADQAATVLDVGCGNGFSTFVFAKERPRLRIFGVDNSVEMIRHAEETLASDSRPQTRLRFMVGNVLELSAQSDLCAAFDYIISERCLISLRNWEEQQQALLQLKRLLKPTGKLILCENTQEGLARLNQLRATLDLPEISVRWHNYYMPEEKLLAFARAYFTVQEVKNIGSLYYIISRVVYAKLCAQEGKQPEYLHPINQVASQLPYLGNFSPNFIFLLENKP